MMLFFDNNIKQENFLKLLIDLFRDWFLLLIKRIVQKQKTSFISAISEKALSEG